MKLYDLAHSRTGDKGNISVISLIPYRAEDYPLLCEKVTAEKVKEHFAGIVKGTVTRYELPCLPALNFVMENGRRRHPVFSGGYARQNPGVPFTGYGNLIKRKPVFGFVPKAGFLWLIFTAASRAVLRGTGDSDRQEPHQIRCGNRFPRGRAYGKGPGRTPPVHCP